MLKKIGFLLFISLIVFSNSRGEGIIGRIADSKTGELLVGCTIYIEELKAGTTTGLDGSFYLKNIPVGNYTIRCSYVSYEILVKKIKIEKNTTINLDFQLEPSTSDLSEVFITAHQDRSTEKSARSSEKNSMNIINVMSSKAIELSPDLNVANVIQRMSGITTERNSSGEAQYAILRGMDKRYNYTLVNGVKVPSPNNKHRYIPLDLFPSELLDRVEVTKSLTADMEGDATGGVINIMMKDAPGRLLIQANAALGYNTRFLTLAGC